MRRKNFAKPVALAVALTLLGAACGDDDDSSSESAGGTTSPTSSEGAAGTTSPTSSDGAGGTTSPTGSDGAGGGACDEEVDTSIDADDGEGAGLMQWTINCAAESPLEASGDPITIGWMNPEGDPNFSAPEISGAAQAAVDYVNNTLGGVGADLKAGTPGRPLELKVCNMTLSPADSQRCANQLVSDDNFVNVSTINFFGNQLPILQASGAPTFILLPVALPDMTTDGIFAIGSGGGCAGLHPGLIEFVTNDLGARRVAVAWSDNPAGVVCYYDLEKKPIEILNGTVEGPAEFTGSIPDLEHLGIPIKPAQPDVTPQASQILDYKPDAIIFSANAAECWALVNALGRLGWSAEEIPFVAATGCIDTPQAEQAGDIANGLYFVGSPPFIQPDLLPGVLGLESQTYLDAMDAAGRTDDKTKGLAVTGFQGIVQLYQFISAAAAANGGIESLTGDQVTSYMESTSNVHSFGGTPLGCADAVAPYNAVCAPSVAAFQWTGDTYEVKNPSFTGVPIIAGTEIDPGPTGG